MARRLLHQLARRLVVARHMLDDYRREPAEIAGLRRGGPAHDRVRITVEALEQAGQQAGPGDPPVVSPQHPAHRLPPEPGAAAFIG